MTSLILHDIRSAHNVGAIFRTADGVGVGMIYLTGYTPAPLDRFGRLRADVAKSALGAEKTVAWRHEESVTELLARLRGRGVRSVAVEQTPSAQEYRSAARHPDTVYIFGNEVDGLPESVLARVDEVIEIPMFGSKESLNVSVCAGIILYHFVEEL
jgi:23S rRNA (guanosine2251-2'-O)-methyltransferase